MKLFFIIFSECSFKVSSNLTPKLTWFLRKKVSMNLEIIIMYSSIIPVKYLYMTIGRCSYSSISETTWIYFIFYAILIETSIIELIAPQKHLPVLDWLQIQIGKHRITNHTLQHKLTVTLSSFTFFFSSTKHDFISIGKYYLSA